MNPVRQWRVKIIFKKKPATREKAAFEDLSMAQGSRAHRRYQKGKNNGAHNTQKIDWMNSITEGIVLYIFSISKCTGIIQQCWTTFKFSTGWKRFALRQKIKGVSARQLYLKH